MNKNRSAAGLRRSAVAERIRLREEWSALKEHDTKSIQQKEPRFVTKKIKSLKKRKSTVTQSGKCLKPVNEVRNIREHVSVTSDVLRGVVALVDVGAESRALALRAALSALGATVVPSWSPLVTHLIWSQGGSREIRAKARALASRLVSPLWVEGCAAAARRLPEQAFPAPTRASDLPSPRTLRQLLRNYDRENIPINNLLEESDGKENGKQLRLRWSSETSANKTTDTSCDKSADKTDIERRVDTVLRRTLQAQISSNQPAQQKISRRKLFTQKEVVSDDSGNNSDDGNTGRPKKLKCSKEKVVKIKLSRRERSDLAQAERLARRILATCTTRINPPPAHVITSKGPRIVLTGMNRLERRTVSEAVRVLGGRLQSRINKRTTHVLLGTCQDAGTAAGGKRTSHTTGITRNTSPTNPGAAVTAPAKPRTVNALEGAARGCRVLHATWATESRLRGEWIHHAGYEVHHLRKISQKARFERAALGLNGSSYVYDVFNGTRVRISNDAEQRDAAKHLLVLCGAVLVDNNESGTITKRNGCQDPDPEDPHTAIGVNIGQVSSKWVFDSVAAGRIRNKRRYVNTSTSIDRLRSVR